ncbi:MAG TPA: response regulator [Ktedonobacterales bacterium]|jgi:CheY-like chemotaxis protein
MASLPPRPRLAIVNTSEDLIEVLTTFFEEEGYDVASAIVRSFRTNEKDLKQFIAAHDPQVLVWDIALPYEENWSYFERVRQSPVMKGRRFVLTTTNEKRVREVAQPDEELTEIVGKPFDLRQLADAVKRARKAP